MLHIYMKYEAPHSLSTGENMFLANLSQHKQHDTMDVAEIWSPYHGGWQTHHQTFEFQKKNNLRFHHFSPEMQPQKKIKKAKQLSSRRTCWSLCVCFLMFFCADCSQLEKTRQPRAIPASHGLLKMRKASRPFGLDIENDERESAAKTCGSRRLIHRGRGDGSEMSMFFFANTQVMPILSLKSLMVFFPPTMLPAFVPFWTYFKCYNHGPLFSVQHSPLYLDIVSTLEYLLTSLRRQSHHALFWRVWRAPKPGIAT